MVSDTSETIMAKRRTPRKSSSSPDIPPVVRLWLLRILVPLGGYREFVCYSEFRSDALAMAVGLEEWIDPSIREYDKKAVTTQLRKIHQACEEESWDAMVPSCLQRNIKRLADLANLSETDCRILEFAVILNDGQLVALASDCLEELSTLKLFNVLSVVLDLPEKDVCASLSPHGVLAKTGLLSIERQGTSSLREKFDLLSKSFANHILSFDADPVTLLRDIITPSTQAELTLDDFGHISESLSLLLPYLRHAFATGRKGVNIFLQGQPGTGKSQLAKVIAEEFGCELFEIASEDSENKPVDGERRLRAFKAAQCFFSMRRAILLFDEVEDVFDDGDYGFGRKSTAQTRKAWINRMLESNPVPTLWLSNSIQSLDPAFIRRFDMVIELPLPSRRQRERIIRGACSDLLDDADVTRIAEHESLAPAVVTRTASVVRAIRQELGSRETVRAMEFLIGNTLEGQGYPRLRRSDGSGLPELYDTAFINADADLAGIAESLAAARSGRLCLYGPPGTGKTAYGQWLANRLDLPLQTRRASDLMSMWVGESEKKIARTFRQAAEENALLMIDEVDSFLQDRRGDLRGWEISLVNEMLTQIESFPGVFIASTNLMRNLDQAALRRFDLKVRFDFMTCEQAAKLLCRFCDRIRLPAPGPDHLARLARLRGLTPGDFAVMARRHRFHPFASCDALIKALEAECTIKEGPPVAIGFLQ